MSVGSTLLELQEIDLTLMRDKEQLQNLPEIAELARRRKLYIKLKGDARREVDMDDYRQVQQLEITLSDFAKKLDRVEFERTEAHQKLSTIQADEATLKQNLKKIEGAIVALTKQARTHAVDIQSAIDKNERKRAQLFESLDPALGNAYKDASKRFGETRGQRPEHLPHDPPVFEHERPEACQRGHRVPLLPPPDGHPSRGVGYGCLWIQRRKDRPSLRHRLHCSI